MGGGLVTCVVTFCGGGVFRFLGFLCFFYWLVFIYNGLVFGGLCVVFGGFLVFGLGFCGCFGFFGVFFRGFLLGGLGFVVSWWWVYTFSVECFRFWRLLVVMFLNQDDVVEIGAAVRLSGLQNVHRAHIVLKRLVDWVNQNSDGWGYWGKPVRASAKLQEALYVRFLGVAGGRVRVDLTDAELKRLFSPVKAFMTRQNVDSGFLFQGL